ncbi:MAG: hypothetical protein COY69_01815 [Candidatus Magasanikbacteria bacterium CG_4_10_14_0_8_um_filter_32_14]|uniref:Polymerase beta nucleotidyltransferase domain-containing protein n=1 Tax=Candidatus Magasanikbacteria bacterium CG_4_10_14_0_8_um_filter_32_14 TaxID=1974640 RepID=A0A2M7R9I0_9BACT|nr:MAG: hypothetical protein COY69_01815 [Candidatus Magasanikbacteria bacterium CG_4_10_14_0_8_um_filter_32_14]
MNITTQKIIDDIVLKYARNKNVLGIFVFGSVARDMSDEYSDIDIYILSCKIKKSIHD